MGETVIGRACMRCFEELHAVLVPEYDARGEHGGIDTFVSQLAHVPAATVIIGIGKQADVRGVIVGRYTVHMVGSYAFGDEFAMLGDVGGMRGYETFVKSKSVSKVLIPLFTPAVVPFGVGCGGCAGDLYVAFSAVGIDGDPFGGDDVAVERDFVRAMRRDIAEELRFVEK